MKHDLELKVQAWLDGQLPDRQARKIGQWIARDAEAAALAAELRGLKQAMFRNEAAVTLGEPRPFYWSKIQRQIEREAGAGRAAEAPWYARWRRYIAPMAGVAALGCVLIMAIKQAGSPSFDEISSANEGMEAVTFGDQSAQMTVVWLQDNSPSAATDLPATKAIRYQDEPDPVMELW